MGTVINVLLCSFVVVIAQDEVSLEPDRPFLSVMLRGKADLECCYSYSKGELAMVWVKRTLSYNVNWTRNHNGTVVPVNNGLWTPAVKSSDGVTPKYNIQHETKYCGNLTFKSVTLNDSGLYQCWLNSSTVTLFTHGTYLHVYKQRKTINLSESTKNKILTAEGILLFLCVLLPSVSLLCQSRRLNELEKKKVRREEENIYQGLNLDDCCSTYDQIERSQGHGPYQDVCNIIEEEEEIQLEKP